MTSVHVALGLAVALGAFVQGSIGFGIAVVSAPFIVVWAPELMPVAMLVASLAVPVVQLLHGPREIAWRPLRWAITGRVLFTPAGVWVVAAFSVDVIAALVGVLLLVTVAVSLTRVHIDASPRSAFASGAVAGVAATAASIGGPFFALVLQHETPVRVRSTLSWFFVIGSAISLAGLAIGGRVDVASVRAGLLWIPFAVAGYAAAGPARRLLSSGRLRIAVLAFCTLAGTLVVIRALAS
ncbi:MAG TPA: TSUP family transporter [Intrasporangium sp.]|uniref:TSUP family transporter n=1 Tax=Intrasporangium sp. TaxID=1925024 RepID=UPI002B4645F0|nr:TSUP family transporter [Intrasporangium sp.]HKX68834.1 TSUP family transporter [Intrasporangium sp.]